MISWLLRCQRCCRSNYIYPIAKYCH